MARAGKNRSTGQPAATGVGAIPARPRTPDPIHGGMRGKEMNKDEYRKLLRHPCWQKKRLEILSRDGFECRECGSKEKMLHVHHLYYEKDRAPWDYPAACFLTLCETCHEEEHATRYSREQALIASIQRLGVTSSALEFCAYLLDGIRMADEELARRVFQGLIEVLNWCELHPEACGEFVAFSVELKKKYIKSPLPEAEPGATR